jgi:hypothetical protein
MKLKLHIRVFEVPSPFGALYELLGAVVSGSLAREEPRRRTLLGDTRFVTRLLGYDCQPRPSRSLSPRATRVGHSGPSPAVGRGQDGSRAKDGQPMSTASRRQLADMGTSDSTWSPLAIEGVAW